MEQVAHLYRIENKINGKYYIGKHNGWEQNGYWGNGLKLNYSIKKYGIENFTYTILCYETENYIYELEKKLVTLELIENDEKCLNLMAGGFGGSEITESTKLKLSKAKKRHSMYKNIERNEKIRKALLGTKLSEERKEKIRQKAIGRKQNKEQIKNRIDKIKQLIWVNNGSINYRILPNLFEEYKNQGFVRGQIIKRKING